jgi:hypothetical protein
MVRERSFGGHYEGQIAAGEGLRELVAASLPVSGLLSRHMGWSGNLRVIHGMQEVWGSNPHSSTQLKAVIRIT